MGPRAQAQGACQGQDAGLPYRCHTWGIHAFGWVFGGIMWVGVGVGGGTDGCGMDLTLASICGI